MQREVQVCVRSAVASLPQPERLVTVLFYGRRYSYSEVSAFLKIELPTVKKRLYSARQKLKGQLQAALHDASERARRASDGAEGAEIGLARWWSWVIRWVKARQDARKPGTVLAKDALSPVQLVPHVHHRKATNSRQRRNKSQ